MCFLCLINSVIKIMLLFEILQRLEARTIHFNLRSICNKAAVVLKQYTVRNKPQNNRNTPSSPKVVLRFESLQP